MHLNSEWQRKWEDRRTGLHWKTERKSVQFVSRVWFFATPEHRRTKEPLDESERGEWKSWLKAQHSENKDHGIWSHHFMAIDGESVAIVADIIFLSSKITADVDCSHETKRRLLLGRKVMANLDSIFKSRDITLPTVICLVKGIIFLVVMYRCESWTIKKAECRRMDAF